ncbi:subtilase-type proteinase Rrt12p [[Candida] jaroonii]|uniref:Subtilase-type proteinase Rrt12p n=1 Tax=[Candida] jaroonii TaxID=467808 RepID=A0ACA9YDD2_9ASCO|nr:subtilase-type proteinase Rrt12p [[Candida] jaroonii]
MLITYLILLFSLTIVTADNYFVTLKEGETFEDFYASDYKYPEDLRVKDLIAKTFSIGKFKGFVGDFSKKMLERLKKCPYINEVSPDIEIQSLDVVSEKYPPRHLGRISQRKRLKKKFKYLYDTEVSGKDVVAFVIDSGVYTGHPEFEGRARSGVDLTGDGPGDKNGHGTHVAGIIGSSTYGVSKKVNIVEVKALADNGNGSLSKIIAAVEFCINYLKKNGKLGVANLSLGSSANSILNMAIDSAVDDGLIVVAAAGNAGKNACAYSPASAEKAITVGSIDDRTDNLAFFSNYGPCVEILAPGVNIASVNFNETSVKYLSGTSMSSPIVTGIVANLLSAGVHPTDIRRKLLSSATEGKVKKVSLLLKAKTPNLIAFLDTPITEGDSESDVEIDDED